MRAIFALTRGRRIERKMWTTLSYMAITAAWSIHVNLKETMRKLDSGGFEGVSYCTIKFNVLCIAALCRCSLHNSTQDMGTTATS